MTTQAIALRRAHRGFVAVVLLSGGVQARAAACSFEPQGEGRVAAVIDARTLSSRRRPRSPPRRDRAGRDRQGQGRGGAVGDHQRARCDAARRGRRAGPLRPPARLRVPCGFRHTGAKRVVARAARRWFRPKSPTRTAPRLLAAAEAEARQAKKGTWADPTAIKNAESPGDILAGIGRFTVVEGKVLSVRQAGATTYLNFGRNWTRDFAVTISRRMMPAFEAAGLGPKSLENRRIRVRGFVEARGGPRIEALRVGQIEVLGWELAYWTSKQYECGRD